MISFTESGMTFRFPEEDSFYIEKSGLYRGLSGKGVSSVECITVKEKRGHPLVFFIEAKTSAPNPRGEQGLSGMGAPLGIYADRVVKKFVDSLFICYALLSGVRQVTEDDPGALGGNLDRALRHSPQICFVLIIRGQKESWLPDIRDMLKKQMNHVLRIWKAELFVLNENLARKYELIV